MKKRFSVEQITAVLQQVAQGVPVGDVCRQVGISEQTFYRWKKVYGGLQPSEARELKQLRDEVTKLKRLVADLSLDKVMLQDVIKKVLKPVKQREVMRYLDGPLRRQHAAGVSGGEGDAIVGVLHEPERSADGAAAADARAGPDARAVRLSPAARACCAAKAGRSAKSAFIACIPRKAWRCGGSARGGTRRRCIASSGGRPPRATTSGAWTSSPTSSPMAGGSGR